MPSARPSPLRLGPLTAYVSPLETVPDAHALAGVLTPRRTALWLDSARTHPVTGRWSVLGLDPWLTLTASRGQLELRTSASTRSWRGDPLDALQEQLRRYALPRRDALRAGPVGRAIGLMGFLSYDLNQWIERLPAAKPCEPRVPELAWFGMRRSVVIDHLEGRAWAVSLADPHGLESQARREAADGLESLVEQLAAGSNSVAAPAAAITLSPTSTQAEFELMVRRALEHIRAGDVYQVNLAQRFMAPWAGDPLALYLTLRRINPSPFACYLAWDGLAVVSCSPERLVRVQDGWADTRPIAGTRPRGASAEADAMQGLELLMSEKERAEHLMLVDLARNDLGRVCASGTVSVSELMALEEYSHVIHIISNVAGRLRPGASVIDAVRAVFPGGTITGCPKVRCMQILRELEPVGRGLYTGALGYASFTGALDTNIAIRTMVLGQGRLSFHAGAGIVADSDPAREYHETLAKAGALMQALNPSADAVAH